MKHLKQIGKMGIFFVACVVVFGFFGESIFAAEPDSDSSCRAKPFEGVCKEPGKECTPDAGYKKYGHCDTSDTPCCVSDENIPKSGSTPITTKNECDVTKGSDGKNAYCITTVGQNCSTFSLDQIGTCGSGTACCASKGTPVPGGGTSSAPSSSGSSAALNYTPLENLPGFEGQSGDFATYFKNLYLLALWIVGISALFMLVVGGFLYLSSAGNTHLLGTAKKTIYAALIGLIIALISWLLLDTINSDLTNLKLSGLSGAIGSGTGSGGSGDANTGSNGKIPEEYRGKGSGCGGAELQGGSHCEDASQDLSDVLKCMVDKLGSKKMQISSISDDSGGKSIFTQCRDNYSKPPCEHGQNSCHYGGSSKKDKSCAADISGSYMGRSGAASASDVKSAASSCGAGYVLNEGDHVHLSVSGCGCN